MRRLPIYILVDTSGSMKGYPIERVRAWLSEMIITLRKDPYAIEVVYISIITFDKDANLLLPLSELESVQLPNIDTVDSNTANLGAALKMLCERIDVEVNKRTPEQKGDWSPFLFILTDGKQDFNQVISRKKLKIARIVACVMDNTANIESIRQLADHVVCLDFMDSAFQKCFSNVIMEYFYGTHRHWPVWNVLK